jgi:hypothetical protein
MNPTQTAPRVEAFLLVAQNGRPIRRSTRVVFADGEVVSFLDPLSRRAAIAQATAIRARESARASVGGSL